MKYVLDEILEKEKLEEKFNTVFKIPFKTWSKDTLTLQFLFAKRNNQGKELVEIFNWYKKIIDSLNSYLIDTSEFVKLDEILLQSINEQMNKATSKSINTWTKDYYQTFINLVNEINYYKNIFHQNIQQFQVQLDILRDYLDQELQKCKDKFNEYSQSSPVNINEAKKIIIVTKRLEEIYQKCYNDSEITDVIQELELEIEQKEYASILPVSKYLESQQSSTDEEDKEIINQLTELSKRDKSGFSKAKELLSKKNEDCNNRLQQILNQNKKVFTPIIPILKQYLKLNKLKIFNCSQDVATSLKAESLIKQLQQEFQLFSIKIQEALGSNNKLIQLSDITNYFDMQFCMALLKENHQTCKVELENMKKSIERINNIIYERVRESINQFKSSYTNSNYKGLYQSLSALKKVDGIIQHIKQLQQSEKIPEFCDKRLWEIVENSTIDNHEAAERQAQQLIQQVEKDLKKSWDSNNFKAFAQYFKSLKELQEDDPQNQLMQKEYSSFKNFYEEQIFDQFKLITEQIHREDWTQQLSDRVDILQDQVKDLSGTDLFKIVTKSNDQTNINLRDKLNEKFDLFKKETNIQNKCNLLIDLRKICDKVPTFEAPVKKKITECVDNLVANSPDGQKQIFALTNCLSTQNEPVAELILKETQHFSSINTKNFKDKISGQHNPDYINKNLKNLNISTKQITSLTGEEQNNLKKRYQDFQKKFTQLVDQYLKRISEIGRIAEKILEFIEQKKSLNLNSWTQKSQEDCTDLLAQVCAFWTLSSLQEDSIQPEKEIVYKELHASQIFSIMILLGFENPKATQKVGSQLIQVLTGEGKSIVLGILSTILALLGYKVDVVCYSRHLSDRDFGDFEKFFDSLNIKEKIKYGTFTDICDDKINEQGDIRKLSQELFKGCITNTEMQAQTKSILLIDEVDVFFSDSFYGQTYNPCCSFKSKEILNIMNKIWKDRSLNKQTLIDIIFKDNNFLEIINKFPQMERLFKAHAKSMIEAATTINEHKYIFQDGKVGYQLHDSISFSTIYGYSTNFAYFQEMDKGNLSEEQVEQICGINLKCGHFSYCLLPKLYEKILGVTGTLETLNQECLNIVKEYTQKATIIPSMFGSSRLDQDQKYFYITFDKDNFFLTIINQASKHLQKGQPVLIFFKDNSILNEFLGSTHAAQYKEILQILNQQTRHIKTTVDKSCRYGQLTLCERAFGRGKDFYCSNKEINQLGGAVVIQAFFSEDISEEYQIKGRTARQSNEGKFIQVVLAEDIEEVLHIQVEDLKEKSSKKGELYQELDKIRMLLYGEKVKLLTESATQAELEHQKTIKYSEYLTKNLIQDALNMLIQFNSGRSNGKQEVLHFIFLLDDSGSMSSQDGTNKSRWQKLIEAIHTFIQERSSNAILDVDIVSVVYHSSNSVAIAKYESLSKISTILSNSPPRYGGNQFYLAIDETIKILDGENTQQKQAKKVIMFLSDGGDCAPRQQLFNSLDNLKTKYKDKILGFWNIGFGPGAEAGALKDMTDRMKDCGGQYKTAMNLVELQKNFSDLATIETVMTMK